MKSIKHLPKGVHSSLRSSVILFDLTRVVEELIFNSLDAGATKITVSIGVGTSYVKVEDDGSGITRDGLVLLGERNATSKLPSLAEIDVSMGSYGFQGEALGSLSDISLLEIITKARGRPSGYRKVIKGCKCLYLGLDESRQDVGTTVIVRDLFYNQPVRRKYMHSSPKKVLHSVKKCVLRIALVHPQVFFKVIDIESEDELLCTHSSLSPLSLLLNSFGSEISSCLHKLNFSQGVLKLSGYLSGLGEICSTKAYQYVYINSRFICKGPIHKLLKDVADSYMCLDLWKGSSGSQNGKRNRPQTYPTYILNFCCPRSSYDLTFEPSKTFVEFKDWAPILSFIEQAVRHFWSQISVQDISACSEIVEKKCKVKYYHKSLNHNCSSMEFASEEANCYEQKKHKMASKKLQRNTAEVKGQNVKAEYVPSSYHSLQDMVSNSCDPSITKSIPVVNQENGDDLLCVKCNALTERLAASQTATDDVKKFILGHKQGNESLKVDVMGEESTRTLLTCSDFEYRNDVERVSFPSGCTRDFEKSVLLRCPSLQSGPYDASLSVNHEEFEFHMDELCSKRTLPVLRDMIAVVDTDDGNASSEFFAEASWRDNASDSPLSFNSVTKCSIHTELDGLSGSFMKSHPSERDYFTEQSNFQNNTLARFRKIGSGHCSTDFNWYSESPYLKIRNPSENLEHFNDKYVAELNCRSRGSDTSWKFRERKDKLDFGYDTNNVTGGDYLSLNAANTAVNDQTFLCHEQCLDDIIFERSACSDKLTNGKDWLCLDSFDMETADSCSEQVFHIPSPNDYNRGNNPRNHLGSRSHMYYQVLKKRSKRSLSAPPFYKGKKKLHSIQNKLRTTAGEGEEQIIHKASTLPERKQFEHPSHSCHMSHQYFEQNLVDDSLYFSRTHMEDRPHDRQYMIDVQESDDFRKPKYFEMYNTDLVEDFNPVDMEDPKLSWVKWQDGNSQAPDDDAPEKLHDPNDILDILSGILHLTGDSLVPKSINKDCLEDARVLLQLDKKFIPVIAGGTLAIIDQHAADERIRLEELRRKVLSGEGRTVAYLDSEQELVLPEIGYQLLHNYTEQINNWGWIYNNQVSGSFTKNLNVLNRRTATVTLIAVPCILGVKLSDKDLVEFLEQLAETDGSSAMPPSVLRILCFKACRGAIMFGDSLLPSECSLIVEELKQTSLCFQCAHGRPTTAPLVNLETLHKQISQLQLFHGGSNEQWHGLQRHQPSLERASQRLNSTRDNFG
ncbi:PREDICTED: DNA mismatch repair protein MLH3 isoform X2 [Nelumbo nucifera]|uniref:DNA mismatch repair protein MLH3 isoform X2 n=1 Tax=Nelumbo nucifera TaxID=4432 RepID=A0A1U8Q8H8_NELNU|nr:PREDICTED: DNA mismatch repair protein MLH3 isoform X2 [Nelumbo nucifera]